MEDGGQAGAGVAAQEVEVRRLLQSALDALGDLQQRVVDRGAWPGGLHDHRLDDEGRILVATEAPEGCHAREDRRDHQVDDEGAMAKRPLGEIEPH